MYDDRLVKQVMEFSDVSGVSGFEDDVVALARQYISNNYIIDEDRIRNLYIHSKKNTNDRLTVLLDAHSDEVGFIIQAVKPNGTMVFLPLGGWSPSSVAATKVRIRNTEGNYISGVVASKPPHFMKEEDRLKPLSINDMVIDVGATSKQEIEEIYKIKIGAPVVPDVTCSFDEKQGIFFGKAFDCRIGNVALLETLRRLETKEVPFDIVGTLSAQEEVGERGMQVITKNIEPDLAIVFEGCPADDTFQEDYMIQSALRKGPMLRNFDVSMITNPRFQEFAVKIASEKGILMQESVRSGGGTNGETLHKSKKATPSIVIGVPVRYVHSSHGFTTYEDLESAVQLACEIITALDDNIIKSF